MSRKEISIVLRAKNAMAAGLASAGKALQSFGSGVLKVGKWIGVAFLGATTALVGFAAKALTAYAAQQKAEMQLAGSLRAYGESADSVLPKLKKIAAAIQDETGAADEATLAGMARLRMLGVSTDKLEEAARATIALKSIGLEEAAAQKAVAMAMQGNYTMLNRYVPALRTATSETEKAQIVNDLFARGYAQQKELLKTTSGAWGALKGRIVDACEEIGRAIEKSAGIQKALELAGNAVKGFGEKVAAWVDSSRFKVLQQTIQGVVKAMAAGGEERSDMFAKVMAVVKAGFAVAAENVVSILMKAAPMIGKLIGAGAVLILDSVKPTNWNAVREASLATGAATKDANGRIVMSGGRTSLKQLTDEEKAANQAWFNAKRMKELGVENTEVLQGETDATKALAKAWADLVKAAKPIENIDPFAAAKDFERRMNDPFGGQNYRPAGGVDGTGYAYLAKPEAAQEEQIDFKAELAQREEELAEAEEAATKAKENAAKAREMFFSKDARREEKERVKQEAKDKKRMERALEQGRKGRTSAEITRAQEAEKARADAVNKAEDAIFAKKQQELAQANLQDALDALAAVAPDITRTADNTDFLGSRVEALE